MLRGAIISESLLPGSRIEGHGLVITGLARYAVGEVPECNPQYGRSSSSKGQMTRPKCWQPN
jgi:hypothetical protein